MRIIIDANYVCHVAKHAMGGLSFEDKRSGVIFGFLRQVLSLAKKYDTNDFIFSWDSKESKRKKLFPEYKVNRVMHKTEEEKELDQITYVQFNTLREKIIPMLGFVNNFRVEGYESDDIIARITKSNVTESFMIVSSDNDMLQLLDQKRVTIYNIKAKKEYTEDQMIKEYDASPMMWPMVKAIAGCVSDGVPGVVGVGEKTAIKYLNGELKDTTLAYANIRDFPDLYRNRKLVTLPYDGMPDLKLRPQQATSFDGMYKVCETYGFQSLLNKEAIAQWRRVLRAN